MKASPVFKSAASRRAVLEAYEGALARRPLPLGASGSGPERLRVATDYGETAVLAFGPKEAGRPPLLALHGAGTNSSMWLGEAAALARGRRVFAVDIPGEPGMSEEKPLPWEGEAAAKWLSRVVAGLGLREHEVLGLSIGGWIALGYAIRNPEGLRALALLCPSGIGRTRPSFIWKAAFQMARGRRGLEAISRSLYGDFPPPEEAIRIGTVIAESTNPRMEKPRLFSDGELAGIRARATP